MVGPGFSEFTELKVWNTLYEELRESESEDLLEDPLASVSICSIMGKATRELSSLPSSWIVHKSVKWSPGCSLIPIINTEIGYDCTFCATGTSLLLKALV